jgi:hypothetical protein
MIKTGRETEIAMSIGDIENAQINHFNYLGSWLLGFSQSILRILTLPQNYRSLGIHSRFINGYGLSR